MLMANLRQQADILFEYKEGHLYNRWTRNYNAIQGELAGYKSSDGYRRVTMDGRLYLEHRIIFLIHHGYLPKELDHINGICDDNHITNLRECTSSENSSNTKTPSNNTSGVKGIYWDKQYSKWRARVMVQGKSHHLGLFEDLELAELAVTEARDILHKEFANHGENSQ